MSVLTSAGKQSWANSPMGGRLMRLSYHFLVRCTSSQADWVVTWEREEQSTQTHISTPAYTHIYTNTTMHIMFNGFYGKLPNSLSLLLLLIPSIPPTLSSLSLSPLTISLHPSFSLLNSMPLPSSWKKQPNIEKREAWDVCESVMIHSVPHTEQTCRHILCHLPHCLKALQEDLHFIPRNVSFLI